MKKKSRRTQPASTIRKTSFKERNHGLTPSEFAIAQASDDAIIEEYNLILRKTSNLSKHLRDVVKSKVAFLIKEGRIKLPSLNDSE